MKNFFLLIAAGIFVFSCQKSKEKKQSGPPPEEENVELPLVVESNVNSIQKDLINESCLSCHADANATNRQIDLSNISAVANGEVHTHMHDRPPLIKPGCPNKSFFLTIMKEGKMPPPPAERLSAETLKAVEDWIISLKPDAGKTCDDFDNDEPKDTPTDDDEPSLQAF